MDRVATRRALVLCAAVVVAIGAAIGAYGAYSVARWDGYGYPLLAAGLALTYVVGELGVGRVLRRR